MTMQPPEGLVFPDAAGQVVVHLRSRLSPGIKVGIDLTGWSRPAPAVQVSRLGGARKGVFDDARIQVDVYAEDYDTCGDLMDTVRMAMAALPLHVGPVVRCVEVEAVRWLPDIDGEAHPRMNADYLVTLQGAGQTA